MPLQVIVTTYGASVYEVLRRVVAEAKSADPLAPVTLVVPSNLCGVVARRTLARGYRDGHAGVAGLTVATLPRLAELLAAPIVAQGGRRPLTGPVLAAAWRRTLAQTASVFDQVGDHHATVRALAQAHRQLRDLSDDDLDTVAGATPLGADLVRLHRAVVGAAGERFYDTTDLLRAATDRCREEPSATSSLGSVVLFLPQDLDQAGTALVRAFAENAELQVVAAFTGAAQADAAVRRTLDRLGAPHSGPEHTAPPAATDVRHASDADDEVRCIVREVVDALATTPAHRVAVLYGAAVPYARLLHDHLAAAGVAVNGVGVGPVAERSLARGILGVLALPERGMRRDDLFRVLSDAPVRDADGNRVPTSRWERISRRAGALSGDDWDQRLGTHADQERRSAEAERAAENPSEGRIARHQRNADAAETLRGFATGLQERLVRGAAATTWRGLASWALDLFHALFGDEDVVVRLPEEEARAAITVENVLRGLAALDEIEPSADLAALRQVLELELAESLPRLGRFGDGVLVAPLSAAVGLEADVVFVVGLAEDLVPGRHVEDALLPERAREATGGALPPANERLATQRRQLLAAFAAAPRCVASFPRGDLRRHSRRLPSRWLLPTLQALSGDRGLVASRWDEVDGDNWLAGSPSYAGTVASIDRPATEQEWRVRAATAGQGLDDGVVARATALHRARASDAFTRFDGNLAGLDVPDPADGQRIVSPTALEDYATCPHAYFAARLLRVEPVEAPEELVRISALDVGRLVHEAFDDFVRRCDPLPGLGEPWSAGQRELLLEIAREHADRMEQAGLTGHPRLWRPERARILADLVWMLEEDSRWRGERGIELLRSEMAFGMEGSPPVEVTLPDGRVLRFRGSADRVDRTRGGTLVVTDVKTGSTRKFNGLGEDNPVLAGTKLQLPVYAHAARAAHGDPDTPVEASYWFVRRDRGRRIEVPLTQRVADRYAETLAVLVDGQAGGLFPPRPPAQPSWGYVECPYCDPDGLGHGEARARWERKRHDPALESYVRLVEPEALADEEESS